MTSEITLRYLGGGGGGEVPVYSPITASVVLITANVPPLTYHCINEGIAKLASYTAFTLGTMIERFQNHSIAEVSYTGVSPRAPIRPLL